MWADWWGTLRRIYLADAESLVPPVARYRRVLLQSAVPDVCFRARLSIWLRPAVDGNVAAHDEARLFRDYLLGLQEISRRWSVAHTEEAEAALLTWDAGQDPGPDVHRRIVELASPDPADVEHSAAWFNVKRRSDLVQHENATRAREWDRLRDNVLCDPAAARLWWLDGRREKLADLDAMSETFERVAQTFGRPSGTGPSTTELIADVLADFFGRLDDVLRAHLVHQLAEVFRQYNTDDLADRMHSIPGVGAAPPSDNGRASSW